MATRKKTVAEREREVEKAARAPAKKVPAKKVAKKAAAKKAPKKEDFLTPVGKVTKDEAVASIRGQYPTPDTVAEAADMLYTIRERRLNVQKEVDALASIETELRDYLISNLPKSAATGAAGRVARAQIVTEDQPVVTDWDAFYTHIRKKSEFDLLNRALNRSAAKARLEANKKVPGLGTFQVTKVSLTKL